MTIRNKPYSLPLTEIEQTAFCSTEDDLPAKPLSEEMKVNVRWQNIPSDYLHLTPEELDNRIHEVRNKLGNKVTVLGHHYQREEVIKYADFQGDSFLLSKEAAALPDVEYIVFCGVHFMAETACILADDSQKVILPNITAGCSMADMAPMEDVDDAWADLKNILPEENSVIPLTYMNSIAGIKALCGRNNGAVCTSSNAKKVMEWAYDQGERVLFLPDQHLGRNTALELGIPLDKMILWNPFKVLGGNTPEQIKESKIILWQGHCSVHTRFTTQQIETARNRYPQVNVVVHPECPMETVQAADMVGSTEFIRKVINEGESGSVWAVGTEISLVNRLARQNPDKTVFCLDPVSCPCSTMYRIHPAYLLWVLDCINEEQLVNEITVSAEVKSSANIALRRMLDLA